MENTPSIDRNFPARGGGRRTGLQSKACNTRDGRQSFSTKTKGRDAIEIGGQTNLTRGMTLQTHRSVLWSHTLSIIFDNHGGFATPRKINDNPGRPRIQ